MTDDVRDHLVAMGKALEASADRTRLLPVAAAHVLEEYADQDRQVAWLCGRIDGAFTEMEAENIAAGRSWKRRGTRCSMSSSGEAGRW